VIDLGKIVDETAVDELPALAGALEAARVKLQLRLVAPAPEAAEPLLDSEAAGKFLGVSTYYVEQLARERRIPCVRPPGTARAGRKRDGRMVRFRKEDLAAWAAAHVDSGHDGR
jgi:hypothetical protein